MNIAWHLRGYHRQTGHLVEEINLSPELANQLRNVLANAEADPDLIDPHALTDDQAEWIAELLDTDVDTVGLEYFVEAEEDWRTAVAHCESLLAHA